MAAPAHRTPDQRRHTAWCAFMRHVFLGYFAKTTIENKDAINDLVRWGLVKFQFLDGKRGRYRLTDDGIAIRDLR